MHSSPQPLTAFMASSSGIQEVKISSILNYSTTSSHHHHHLPWMGTAMQPAMIRLFQGFLVAMHTSNSLPSFWERCQEPQREITGRI